MCFLHQCLDNPNFPKSAVFVHYAQYTIYIVSSRYWTPLFSITRSLVSSVSVSTENLRLLGMDWPINLWFFPSIRILIVLKLQNMLLLLISSGMQSHLWPQLQASFLPPRSQSNGLRFWGFFMVITILSVSCDWLLIVQKCQDVFLNVEFFDFLTRVSP